MNERNLPVLRAEATAPLCSICPDPGRCCRRFYFHRSYWKDEGLDAAQKDLDEWDNPFVILDWQPQTHTDENGREYAEVICKCSKVTSEGRCSIYESRPLTCRRYAPGSDPLCVFASMSGIQFWTHRWKATDS